MEQSDGFAVCHLIELAALAGDPQDAETLVRCPEPVAGQNGRGDCVPRASAEFLRACGGCMAPAKRRSRHHPEKVDLLIAGLHEKLVAMANSEIRVFQFDNRGDPLACTRFG
jgi:hypothetical protein